MYTKNPVLLVAIIFSLLSSALFAGENEIASDPGEKPNIDLPTSTEEWEGKVVVIPITGVIASESYGGQEENIIQAIKRAEKAQRIILEINSPGGAVESCDRICQALIDSPVTTTALIIRKAVSGGAMVATACSEIYMLSGSRIGDIQPMLMLPGQTLDERSAEKVEADVRAIMAANAKHNGYPKVILEAMVSRSFEVYEVNFKNGEREFLNKSAYQLLRQSMAEGIDTRVFSTPPKIVVTAGKLLSVEAQSAVAYGIATNILSSRDELFSTLNINPENVVEVRLADGELDPLKLLNFKEWKLSKGLTMILILCLIVGIAGTLTEMSMPGFGLPGALGIIGFASFFTILFLNERATFLEIGLFIAGIILLIIEIVVIPGFGVAGIIGLICLLAGLIFSLIPALDSSYMEQNFGGEMIFAGLITGGVLIVVCTLILIMMEKGGKSHLFKSLFLEKNLPEGRVARQKGIAKDKSGRKQISEQHLEYLGVTATAYTPLHPSGKIRLDNGTLLDVITSGSFIDKGAQVKIIAVNMNRVVVELYTE